MAYVYVQHKSGTPGQFSRQKLRRIWLRTRPQAKAGASCSAVSYPNGFFAGLTLLLLFFTQIAHGSSIQCVDFRSAAEHNVEIGGHQFVCHHAGQAPGNYPSCSSGGENCWTCSDLGTSTSTNRQPVVPQPISSYEIRKDVLSESSLRQFKEWPSYQYFKMRKLGPTQNQRPDEGWGTEVGPGLHSHHWNLVDIATVCTTNLAPSLSVSVSTRPSHGVKLEQKNLQLDVASTSWTCNSTIMPTAASRRAAATPTTDSTNSATASSDFSETTISLHMASFHIWSSNTWLLEILHAVDGEIQATGCNHDDGDGPQSSATRRRVLISDSWKPVIVADSVVVGIGFAMAVLALSCWVWQQRTVKYSYTRPPILPSSPTVALDDGYPNPRRVLAATRVADVGEVSRSRSGGESGRAISQGASGRWSQVREGPGRWVQIEEEVLISKGLPAGDGRGPPVPIAEEGDVAEEGEGVADGPSTELKKGEEGRSHAVNEVSFERAEVTEEGTAARSTETDGEGTATAHRSSPTAGNRAEPLCFRGLSIATGGFDDRNRVGEGSFGNVYRGLLFDGREVAIKRADRNNMEKLVDVRSSFKAEVDVLSRLHHKHLVNLVGYCDECDEMMLVYEYMPNGTLSDHVHNKQFPSRSLSSWKVRIRVALQAARGIEYLHTYAEPPVIHRDIKSSNILLDAKGSARVSDFGLCLIFPSSSSDEDEENVDGDMGHSSRVLKHLTTKAAGTIGYMDPEYYRHRHLTTKSDVYSFGVVILELLTGKKAIFRRNNSLVSLIDYVVPAMEAEELASILDPRVQAPNRREFLAVEVMAEVGRQAVRLRGKDRPSMTEIIRRLEEAVTLCRPRHAPLPVFGAQIGSSTSPSPSPDSLPSGGPSGPSTSDRPRAASRSDPATALPFYENASDDEEDEGPSGTNIAQRGSLSSSQVQVLEEFLQEIHPNGSNDHDEDDDFDQHLSSVDIQFSFDAADPHHELYRRQPAGEGESDLEPRPSTVMPDAAGSSSSAAMKAVDLAPTGSRGGGRQEWRLGSSLWRREELLQELQESSRRQSRSPSSTGKFDISDESSLQRQRGSYYSCEGASGEGGSAEELPAPDFFSVTVVDDPLLDQRASVLAGFSNFSDIGPPEDLNPRRRPPPLLSQEQLELGSQLVRAAHGFREGYPHESEPSDHPGPVGQATAAAGLDKGKEVEREVDDIIADIDIQEFLGAELSEERAEGGAAYAGFSNFSVLHDLDELMKALHSLHAQQEQEELAELREQQQQEENLWKDSKSSSSSIKG